MAWLVKTCGFDGVQWDYEVCLNGDPRLLDLLRDTRAALPSTAILGVCSAPWYPAPIRRWIGWDEDYFSNVAASCDQIAVMAYDSGLFFLRGYVWFMREQTQRVPRAVAAGNPRCRVLLGVPTYEDGGGKGHSAYAENLRMALKGIRASSLSASSLAGIALFADYTTSVEEWEAYRRWWLER